MLPKQKYSKIPLVTLKIEVKISLPHYARIFFMQRIIHLGSMNDISKSFFLKWRKKCLF